MKKFISLLAFTLLATSIANADVVRKMGNSLVFLNTETENVQINIGKDAAKLLYDSLKVEEVSFFDLQAGGFSKTTKDVECDKLTRQEDVKLTTPEYLCSIKISRSK